MNLLIYSERVKKFQSITAISFEPERSQHAFQHAC